MSRYQVFVLETKNYVGTIYGEESDTYWTQAVGRRERLFYNPVLQNAGHRKALLNRVGIDVHVQSVVVFSERARLRVNLYMEKVKVLNNRDLLNYIYRFKRNVLTEGEVKRWNEELQALQKRKRRRWFSLWREHLQFVRSVQKAKRTASEERACPKCGAKLVLRNGQFGEFYGCSSFPVCRYSMGV